MRELRQDWRDLFFGFRIALDPKKMMLGFVGLLVSVLILLLLTWAFFPAAATDMVGVIANPMRVSRGLPEGVYPRTELGIFLRDALESAFTYKSPPEGAMPRPPVVPERVLRPVAVVFAAIAGLLLLLIWSFFGGAIMRIAAVELAKDDRIDISEATAFAKKKYLSFFWGPVVPYIGIAFFILCILIGGWVGRIPYLGPLVVGIFFFLAILAAFLILFIAIGGVLGVPLMGATIAYEGTDAFDAISRAYSYIFSRPWRLLWYGLVACAYGLAVTAFVVAFTSVMLKICLGVGGAAMGAHFEPIRHLLQTGDFLRGEIAPGLNANICHQICAVLVKAAIFIVWGLVLGYVVSYLATQATIIYSLLRKAVDGTDMTEVYIEEEEEAAPAPEAKPAEAAAPAPAEGAAPAAPPAEQPKPAEGGEAKPAQ